MVLERDIKTAVTFMQTASLISQFFHSLGVKGSQ